jgi:Ca2+/Na+ antiporter
MKNNIKETLVTLSLVVLAVLLLNPFHFWMPDVMVMCILAIILGVFALFASFVLRENKYDEREEGHRALAGRNAFLVGAGILTLGIVVQGYTHIVDPWLVITLVAMIVVKIITRIWSDKNL